MLVVNFIASETLENRFSGATLGCRVVFARPSNYVQHAHSLSAPPIARLQLRNSLCNLVIILPDHLRFGFRAPTVINTQALLREVYRHPDILTAQTLRNTPPLFQDFDKSICANAPHKRHPPFGQRQLCGQARHFSATQLSAAHFISGFFDAQALQSRRRIIFFVPPEKLLFLPQQITPTGKVIFLPETRDPQSVDPFNRRVAFGFGGRNEEQFNPKVQTAAHETPENTGLFAQSSERCVVVYLPEVGYSQLRQAVQQMSTRGLRGLVGRDGLVKRVSLMVKGVKDKDLLTAFQVTSQPITGDKENVIRKLWRRLVGFCFWLGVSLKNAGFAQPAFDRRDGRNRLDQTLALQLQVNNSRANKSDFGSCETGADSQHKLARATAQKSAASSSELSKHYPQLSSRIC